ncbi:MAG: hypothetical protein U9O59_00775 [Actinomycetota bacterium]|nr:hypothetical protein [Actinomycetota bacterium]
MKTVKIKIKKVFLFLLIIVVSFLVLSAFYFNRHKFEGINIVRYTSVILEDGTSVESFANKYSDKENKTKFVSEIKKMNNLGSSDYIPGNSTLIIPIIESE